MTGPIRIFLSTDDADETLAYDLEKQLRQAFAPRDLLFWHERPVAEEDYRRLATAFLETAHLFLPIVSVNYLDTPDARWELEQALSESARRPSRPCNDPSRGAAAPTSAGSSTTPRRGATRWSWS